MEPKKKIETRKARCILLVNGKCIENDFSFLGLYIVTFDIRLDAEC